jgi:hypothetical protein
MFCPALVLLGIILQRCHDGPLFLGEHETLGLQTKAPPTGSSSKHAVESSSPTFTCPKSTGRPRPSRACNAMTPLQNDPQQHRREATRLNFRVSCAGQRSPDSESARRELSKSGLACHVGPQACTFTSHSGGGSTVGAPTWTRVRPRRTHCTTETVSRNPYRLRCSRACKCENMTYVTGVGTGGCLSRSTARHKPDHCGG